jgi:hypothetical protein
MAHARDPSVTTCSAKRPRRMGLCSEVADDGENLEDHPRLASRYVRRKAPFQRADRPANSSRARVEPFSFRPDKTLPGTLHHSGIRPAPPSDHTPLARRSAFQHGRKPARRGNSDAPAGLKPREDLRCRHAGKCILPAGGIWNFVVPLPLPQTSAGDFRESKRRGIYAERVGNPGSLAVVISDSATGPG